MKLIILWWEQCWIEWWLQLGITAGVFFMSWHHRATNVTDQIHESISHNTDHDTVYCVIISCAGLVGDWERPACFITCSHHGSLLFSQSKHSNYRRCQSLSDVASVINPAHWTQDIRHEHTCRGVKSSPAPRPAVQPASSAGIQWESILCRRLLFLPSNICLFQPTKFQLFPPCIKSNI